jgi:CBS domain-containing protein
VRQLVEILVENEISGVPVVDALDRVVGVVSKTDLLNRCLSGPGDSGAEAFFVTIAEMLEIDLDIDADSQSTVEDFMSPDPFTASPGEPVVSAARRMAENHVHRLIVTDSEGYVVGVVTTLDLLEALAGQKDA